MLEAERVAREGGPSGSGSVSARHNPNKVLEDHPELAEHLASIPDELMMYEMDDL
jgi:hypothetical protein